MIRTSETMIEPMANYEVPANAIDLIGQRFGRLNVIALEQLRTRSGQRRWRCVCDCGTWKTVQGSHLRNGQTTSCGCLQRETAADRCRKHGQSHMEPEYRAWKKVLTKYGERPKRWSTFERFLADVGPRPSPRHRLVGSGWRVS
jgi:hypothetical protein